MIRIVLLVVVSLNQYISVTVSTLNQTLFIGSCESVYVSEGIWYDDIWRYICIWYDDIFPQKKW